MSKYNVEYILNLKDRVSAGLKNVLSSTSRVDSGIESLKGSLMGLAGGFLTAAFVKDSVMVAAEFEKLEAVLANTLGSRSAAATAMARIEQFAVKTPFEVKELSDSFIKLANRGAKPTNRQMTAMGDVASALGKDFSQVTDAVMDINNTERWNEIGIKAKTVGDKVSFTFKGMTVEVDRTEQGVLSAIEAFGQMEGVAGTMASVMDTTAGKISNFGDVWTNFQKTAGQAFVEIESSLGLFEKGAEFLVGFSGLIKAATGEWTMAQVDYNTVIKTEGDLINQIADSNSKYIDILNKQVAEKTTLKEKTDLLSYGLQTAFQSSSALNQKLDEAERLTWTGGITDYWANVAVQAEASKMSIQGVQMQLYQFLSTLDEVGRNEAFANIASQMNVSAESIKKLYTRMNAEETAGLSKAGAAAQAGPAGKPKTGARGAGATSSTLTSRSPQTFNINITKLVETINTTKPQLNTTDSQTMRQITEALVMAVNDVQTTVQ